MGFLSNSDCSRRAKESADTFEEKPAFLQLLFFKSVEGLFNCIGHVCKVMGGCAKFRGQISLIAPLQLDMKVGPTA